MASAAGGGRMATSSSKRHASSSSTAENLGKVKSVAVASTQHGAKKRPALTNVTNQQRGSFYPGRSSLSESYKIVPCTEKIVSTKASSSYKNANISGTTLPASSPVKPSIVASSKNATLPKSDIVSKILASPAPSSMDTSPDQSDKKKKRFTFSSNFPMAEVSNLHRFNHRQPITQQQTRIPISNPTIGAHEDDEEFFEQNPFVIDLDSLSPPNNPNSNPSFFISDDYDNTFNFGFDLNIEPENSVSDYADSLADPNCFFYGGGEDDEEEEQMNFVTDLFESREAHFPDNPIWEFDSGLSEDLGVEFGFGPALVSAEVSSPLGLRVVGMDSESDSEEFEVNSGFIDNNDDNFDGFGVNTYHLSENEREEFEWEEVNERIQFDESENLNSVIDRIEEISVSSDFSSSEGANPGGREERDIEWEVLLAVNNLDRNFEFENQEEHNNGNEIPHLDLSDDYILTVEYGTLFGQLVENESALKGSPPAAKSVVENLPLVELTKEEVGENNDTVVCTVCKDEVAIGEKVTRMPCCHLYHGDCIVPWLKIRNTCPVCRYELPTDDVDYEKRRTERSGVGIASPFVDDLQARYNFELLP